MEHQGKVIAVLPLKSGTSKSGKEWTTQEFVVETQEQYPKRACFVLFGKERIEQSNVQVGQELKVSFDIDAREWKMVQFAERMEGGINRYFYDATTINHVTTCVYCNGHIHAIQ